MQKIILERVSAATGEDKTPVPSPAMKKKGKGKAKKVTASPNYNKPKFQVFPPPILTMLTRKVAGDYGKNRLHP